MPAGTRTLLLRGLGLTEADCYEISGMVDLTGLRQILELNRPDLRNAFDYLFAPVTTFLRRGMREPL